MMVWLITFTQVGDSGIATVDIIRNPLKERKEECGKEGKKVSKQKVINIQERIKIKIKETWKTERNRKKQVNNTVKEERIKK